jgi:hypothetical protein
MSSRYLIGYIFMLVGCHNLDSLEILKLDIESQNELLPKITNLRIIQLEKGDESMIGEIFKVDCFYERFYIQDVIYSKTLFAFDESGSFINKTPRGRGPGEVILPWGYTFDKDLNQVLVWDRSIKTMLYYDPNLKFLHSYINKDINFYDFEKYSDGTLLTFTHSAENSIDTKS